MAIGRIFALPLAISVVGLGFSACQASSPPKAAVAPSRAEAPWTAVEAKPHTTGPTALVATVPVKTSFTTAHVDFAQQRKNAAARTMFRTQLLQVGRMVQIPDLKRHCGIEIEDAIRELVMLDGYIAAQLTISDDEARRCLNALPGAGNATFDGKRAVRFDKDVVVVEGGILRMGTEENVRASFRGSPVEPSLVDRLSLGQNGMFSNSINVNANDIESVYKRARGHESQFVWEGVWTLRRDDQAEAVDRQVTEALTKFETQPGFSKAVLCKLKHQHLDRQAMFSVTFDGDAATQEAQLKQIMAVVARAESVE